MNYIKRIFFLLAVILTLTGCHQKDAKLKKAEVVQPTKKSENTANINIGLYFDAALDGNYVIIQKALKQGFDVNANDTEGRTALMLSAFNGHSNLVKLLLEKGADVNITDYNNRTALMFASTGPFIETIKILLNANADVNIVDNIEQFSALMFAAGEGQLEIVKILLEYGADNSLKDIDDDGAFDFAKINGHHKVAEYLSNK